jgi:hypothetical protein
LGIHRLRTTTAHGMSGETGSTYRPRMPKHREPKSGRRAGG